MSDNPAKEAFTDMLTHLERLETLTGALLQLLKDNGTATDEKLAPYLEQASTASDVRMRAARARLEHLFTADEKAKPATEAAPPAAQKESLPKKDAPAAVESKPKTPEQKNGAPSDKHTPSEIVSATMTTKESTTEKTSRDRSPSDHHPSKDAA